MSDDRRPGSTLDQVARAAGVSRSTVSRVVNGTRNVDPEIARTVQEAIDATGYVPNRAARSLRTRRLGAVALVVATADWEGSSVPLLHRSFTDPFFGRIVGAALLALQERDVRLELLLAEDDPGRAAIVQRLDHRDVDGMLIVSMHTDDPLPALVAATGKPAVLLGKQAAPVALTRVDTDHAAGAALAAGRLVARGCRRIATIAGPETAPGAAERLGGFLSEMERHGVTDVPMVRGAFSMATGETAMADLLAAHPDVDGVFAENDLMAQGALHVLRGAGRRVPDDVAVIGFDDSSIAADTRPTLTTVRQPLEAMGAEMARLLLEQVEEPNTLTRTVVLPPSLVVRNSA